jgi:hypothetical protein
MIDEFKHDNIGATLMHQLTDSISGGGSDSENTTHSPSRSCTSPNTRETGFASRSNSNEMPDIAFIKEENEHLENVNEEITENVVHVELDIQPDINSLDVIPPSTPEEGSEKDEDKVELSNENNEELEVVIDDDSTFTEEDVRIRRRLSSTTNGQQVIHSRLCYKVVFSAGAYIREEASYHKDVKKVGTIDVDEMVESTTKNPTETVTDESGEIVTWIKLVKPVEGWIPLVNQKGQKVVELVEENADVNNKDEIVEEQVRSVASKLLGSVIDSALDNTAQPK